MMNLPFSENQLIVLGVILKYDKNMLKMWLNKYPLWIIWLLLARAIEKRAFDQFITNSGDAIEEAIEAYLTASLRAKEKSHFMSASLEHSCSFSFFMERMSSNEAGEISFYKYARKIIKKIQESMDEEYVFPSSPKPYYNELTMRMTSHDEHKEWVKIMRDKISSIFTGKRNIDKAHDGVMQAGSIILRVLSTATGPIRIMRAWDTVSEAILCMGLKAKTFESAKEKSVVFGKNECSFLLSYAMAGLALVDSELKKQNKEGKEKAGKGKRQLSEAKKISRNDKNNNKKEKRKSKKDNCFDFIIKASTKMLLQYE